MKIAIFDIGTNSIHMLIVEIHKDLSFEILDHEKDTTRLGDGSFETGRLSQSTIERGVQVIDRFYKIAKKSQVRKVIAVATSAVREAKNGGELVDRVFKKTGIKVRVITGEEEGRLIFLAARSSVDTRGEKALVMDIGGGSVELVLGNAKEIFFLDSLKLGVARLTDHFISSDPLSKRQLRRLKSFIEKELHRAIKKIRKTGFSMVIGTSGTIINLAMMVHYQEESTNLDFVNHFELTAKALGRLHDKLARTSLKERLKMPGLDPKRADLIVAGSVLLTVLLDLLKADRITLSDKAIREGTLLDFIEKNKKKIKGEEEPVDIRERSVRQLARRCGFDQVHAEHVAALSLSIFDQTKLLHKLGPEERELLYFASLLHDIGYHVSFNQHHKHSYYLIVNSDLDGFDPEAIEIMGAVARYHRKRMPKREDEHFKKVGLKNVFAVKVLAAILRIADGLDRTHFSVVKSVGCRIRRKYVLIRVKAQKDAELELWQANQRKDLFEAVFKKKVTLQLAKRK